MRILQPKNLYLVYPPQDLPGFVMDVCLKDLEITAVFCLVDQHVAGAGIRQPCFRV